VQHLSPNHESYLPQILSRKTTMPVLQAKNRMEIKKNHVYVIPPNNSLIITDGILKLVPRKGRLNFYPVDLFLSSLGRVYRNNAIGIILSGTASDGTLGLKEIKAEGGITFAQDETALYQGMPKSAIDLGYVDFVLPPEKIALELRALSKNPLTGLMNSVEYLRNHTIELEKINAFLFAKKNIDFAQYKQTTIYRRIMRRMLLNKLNSLADYVQLLSNNNSEINALHQDLLINVTDFFRDPGMNNAMVNIAFPTLIKNRKLNNPIRIWVPGCSTGEEVITIAMLLIEFLGAKSLTIPIQIFGTDLNEKAIEKARQGLYPKTAVQNISEERLQRFFIKTDGHYQVIKTLRDVCILAPHNLLKDPPFSNLDLVSCQNLLIYLAPGPQQRVMQTFHYALKDKGFLVLGKSETIGLATDLFEAFGKNGHKLYQKKQVHKQVSLEFSPRVYQAFDYAGSGKEIIDPRKVTDIDRELEKLLLADYVPPGLLINKNMEIIRFLGAVSPYLEPSYGKASFQLMKMVKEEIAYELRSAIIKAKKSGRPEKKKEINLTLDQKNILIHFEVVPLKAVDRELYFLVLFGEIVSYDDEHPANAKGKKSKDAVRLAFVENQLREARHNVKIISEEFDAMREELQSSNEEALSSNEELQSINEELETSKEELQSMNEELMTINEELHRRNFEMKELTDYADAIFESKHEALVILSDNLRVKIANKGFYSLFNVDREEIEGELFVELGNRQWNLPELEGKLKMVQQKQIPVVNYEARHLFPGIGEKELLLNAQKLPMSNGKESLILLAIHDITERNLAERQVKKSEERFRLLIQNASDIITLFDYKGVASYITPSVETVLGFTVEERTETNIFDDPSVHPDDRAILEQMFNDCLQHPGKNVRAEFRLKHRNGRYLYFEAIAINLLNDIRIASVITNYRDITERKVLEQQKDDFIGIASHELKTPVTSIKAYAQILQENFKEAGNEPAADMAAKMDTQVDRLTKLISDLLDFTHIEVDKLTFRSERYDINKLIVELAEEIQRSTRKKIMLKLAKPVTLLGDRFRMGEVLGNLIGNAIKYSPDADCIVVSTKSTQTEVIISVKDFGIGIGADKLERIFDRFYRVSQVAINTFPGLGLGLYLAAQIIKKQNGKIWVKSELGKGSTFFFSLPK
jgi:two-component system CheB/CheR fusion protein